MLNLLIPALIPSWRFFDTIAPSPRIEFTCLQSPIDTPQDWHEFRPRPHSVSLAPIIKRLIWNPDWNESLFLVSCAERLMQNPTDHSRDEIFKRIARDVSAPYLQFRLVFIERDGAELRNHVTYLSPTQSGTAS